jgi:hypothetical protein
MLCLDELGYLELDHRGAELLSRSSPSERSGRPSSPTDREVLLIDPLGLDEQIRLRD